MGLKFKREEAVPEIQISKSSVYRCKGLRLMGSQNEVHMDGKGEKFKNSPRILLLKHIGLQCSLGFNRGNTLFNLREIYYS